MTARAPLLLLLLLGCGPGTGGPLRPDDLIDSCVDAPAGQPCVTLHVHGKLPAIDNVIVDATYRVAGKLLSRRVISRGPTSMTPVAVGVILPVDAIDFTFLVIARLGDLPVGIGEVEINVLTPNGHYAADVDLSPAAQSDCFDGVRDGSESDIDCGGPYCPYCPVGDRCGLSLDCANSTCVLQSGIARCM